MLFFSRKKNRKKKSASKPDVKKPASALIGPVDETQGYDPYDTLPGVSREKFGMRRQDDDKWSF